MDRPHPRSPEVRLGPPPQVGTPFGGSPDAGIYRERWHHLDLRVFADSVPNRSNAFYSVLDTVLDRGWDGSPVLTLDKTDTVHFYCPPRSVSPAASSTPPGMNMDAECSWMFKIITFFRPYFS